MLTLGLLLAAAGSQAGLLVWDAGNPSNGATIDPASGNWDTTAGNNVWNNGSGNVAWTQTSTTAALNGALFGGANGTYVVTLDASQIALTNLTFTNSGYTIAGTYGLYFPANSTLNFATGVTTTVSCPLPGGNNAVYWQAATNATVLVTGNMTSTQQPRFLGPGSYFFSGVNTLSVPYILGPVFQTNGSFSTSASFFIGYPQTVNGVAYTTGTFTVDGPTTTFAHTAGDSIIGRAGGTGTFIIRNGATASIGQTSLHHLRLAYDNNTDHATMDVQNGTLNVGTPSYAGQIIFGGNGAPTGQTAVMTQEGGTVNTYGGLTFGGTTASTGGTAGYTMSGGTLYLGAGGMAVGTYAPTATITLSGGIVGALGNWSGALPLTLASTNGDVTLQCADSNGNGYNITLAKALTGPGGLKKTGAGTLTLSGANTYAGTTVVSNGTLVLLPGNLPTNGPVILDGSVGAPVLSVQLANAGQYWSIGNLTCGPGAITTDFSFGVLPPSTATAPLQVAGSVAFTATPTVTVEGSAIAVGTYPLIKYTGTVSGTPPVAVTLPAYASGYVTNLTATKTVALVVTASTYNPALYWRVGDGVWDINTTANWTQFGGAVKYSDGSAVVFDDTASGGSPLTVTLNTMVNPFSITANNAAKNYAINGTGAIAGPASLTLLGSGALTLWNPNTYTGGTTVSAGQLNLNNGGNVSASAIGTGALTLNAGASLDNTSGTNVVLAAANPEFWNGSFSYLGAANSLNTGVGTVTLGGSLAINVVANTFTVGGSISDAGAGYKLTKTGNGALTLAVANGFGTSAGGGLTLSAGLLNIGDAGALGYGTFTIDGGSIDNISGQSLTVTPAAIFFGAGFTFVGTTNLDLGAAPITFDTAAGTPMVLNVVSNTLSFDGALTLGNNMLVKNGNGAFSLSGAVNDGGVPMTINAGRINLDKSAGNAIGVAPPGVTVNTNGLLIITGTSGDQIHDQHSGGSATPVSLVGGAFDLNGQNEMIDALTLSYGGTVRNGAAASSSTLSLYGAGVISLANSDGFFDVPAPDGVLNIASPIGGVGSLAKTGLGLLNLSSNNPYAGNTMILAGTLALLEPAAITNSARITLAAGATLDVSARADQTLTLGTGQTLAGAGGLNGNLFALAGSTVAPGAPVGTLFVSNSVVLAGNLLLALNRTNAPSASGVGSILGTITYGGTLWVTNAGPALQVGDVFPLFPAAVTTFTGISLPTTDASGNLYTWNNNVAVDGSIKVLAVQSPVNRTPINLGFALSGSGSLALSWPPDHLGWTLITNAAGLTATNAWFVYPGSASVTNLSLIPSAAASNVFFRLVAP